jgi:putative DNA primase/helicase
MPDTLKSTITLDIMARVTRGSIWPYTSVKAVIKNVLLLTTEDDIDDTIAPRLLAAGADMSRVFPVSSIVTEVDGSIRGLSLAQDIDLLRREVAKIPDVGLIVIDPLGGYLGAKNSHSDADMRSVLIPFCDFAQETGIAVIGIAHLNKNSTGQDILHRVSGSGAMGAVARSVYMTIEKDDVYYMAKAKANLAPREDGFSLIYEPESVNVQGDGEQIRTSRIKWTGTSEDDARKLMAAIAADRSKPKRHDASEWLREQLSSGSKEVKYLKEDAASEGHSWRTLERLKSDGEAYAHKTGYDGGWCWHNQKSHDKIEAGKRSYRDIK